MEEIKSYTINIGEAEEVKFMDCKNCLVVELTYEIRFEGNHNLSIIPDVVNHLLRRNIWVKVKDERLKIKESGVREFLDFCTDHMQIEEIYFRIEKQQWNPLTEIDLFIETNWIDEVIQKELITCHFQPIVDRTENNICF